MESWRPRRRAAHAAIEVLRAPAALAIPALLAGVPLLLIAALVPSPLVVPTFSVLFLGLSGITALFALRTGAVRRSPFITSWDVAGAFAFLGFAAAILSRPETILTTIAPVAGG